MKTKKIIASAPKNIRVRENKTLDGKYDNDPFFLKKMEMMDRLVKTVGLPKL